VRLEGLGSIEKSNCLIRNRNRDLPACSIVPQPTIILLAPKIKRSIKEILCENMNWIHLVQERNFKNIGMNLWVL
jgi:hypothetical protein